MKLKEETVKYGNVILEKSFKFSLKVIKLYRFLLKKDCTLEPILKQILNPELLLMQMSQKLRMCHL